MKFESVVSSAILQTNENELENTIFIFLDLCLVKSHIFKTVTSLITCTNTTHFIT